MRDNSPGTGNRICGLYSDEKKHLSRIIGSLKSLTPSNDHHRVGIGMTACVLAADTDSPEDILDRLAYMEQWIADARLAVYRSEINTAFGKRNAQDPNWFLGPHIRGTGMDI